MIELNEHGERVFRGRLLRDYAVVTAELARVTPKVAECLAEAFDAIERGECPVFRLLKANMYGSEACGYWIGFALSRDQDVGTIVILSLRKEP